MEIVLDAIKKNIETLTKQVDELLEKEDCSPKSNIQIDVAIDEVFCNIASYAYPDGAGKAKIVIDFFARDGAKYVKIVFIDQGIEFNPLDKPDPDITLGVEERQIGGLGIFMVKKTMDEVTYEYRDGSNMLTLVKKI